MSPSEFESQNESDSAVNEDSFVRQLRTIGLPASGISSDELMYRAGWEAAIAAEERRAKELAEQERLQKEKADKPVSRPTGQVNSHWRTAAVVAATALLLILIVPPITSALRNPERSVVNPQDGSIKRGGDGRGSRLAGADLQNRQSATQPIVRASTPLSRLIMNWEEPSGPTELTASGYRKREQSQYQSTESSASVDSKTNKPSAVGEIRRQLLGSEF